MRLADGQAERAQLLIEVLGRLVLEGKLKLAPARDKCGAPTLIDHAASDSLILTHEALVRALVDLPVSLLDETYVAELLEHSGVWRGTLLGAWLLGRAAVLTRWGQPASAAEMFQGSG